MNNHIIKQQRRAKPKIEKSNEEFKQHERIIMDKRIAEVNNVITKKCHTIWNQYLYLQKKPHTLQFSFVYHGLENYLSKCDDYKAEQHKDNKQKWWNNQKASEMSQQFLPSVLNSTDHMAQYLGKQIQSNLQLPFTNYVTFELLETATTSVFSTQRSGSNEVFLRTSFQYAKAGLRKKLVSYFGDGELRVYDTKSRKKKDLWQRLIKDKKEKLLQIFQHKQSMYSTDSKAGILNGNNGNNAYFSNNNNGTNMYAPPSTHNGKNNGYSNGWKTEPQNYDNLMDLNVSNYNMSQTLPFPQPLLMDITLTYPKNATNSVTHTHTHTCTNGAAQAQAQAHIPPPLLNHTTKYTPAINNIPLAMNTNRQTMMLNGNGNGNGQSQINISNGQCRQCLSYMGKISDLLRVNGDLNRDSVEIKQLNIKYSAERDHWKSQYEQLLAQYQQLLRTNNELIQEQRDKQMSHGNINGCDDGSDLRENMSVSKVNVCVSPSNDGREQIPLDDLCNKTPKELQPFNINGFGNICGDNSAITPYQSMEGMNGFPFPKNESQSQSQNQNNKRDKSEMSANVFGNGNGNKCAASVAASVMSICSNDISNNNHVTHPYFNTNNRWSMQ